MFGVTILGNNSALPAYDRHPTAQVVTLNEGLFLFDCGEGTQMQMNRYKIRRSRINHIFISHLHGDHYFGLVGLLTSMSLCDRKTPLHVYGPPDLETIIRLQVMAPGSGLPFEFFFHPIQQPGVLVDEPHFSVSCFPVYHRIDAWGFIIKEKRKPRKIDANQMQLHPEIPRQYYDRLQMGEDYIAADGTIVKNETITRANTPPRSYAYCADTIFSPAVAAEIKGVTLLYHEATYLKEKEERAAARHHSTTTQAATIAALAGAQQLLIGHFSSQYHNEQLHLFEEEARAVFPNTQLAIEGVTYTI